MSIVGAEVEIEMSSSRAELDASEIKVGSICYNKIFIDGASMRGFDGNEFKGDLVDLATRGSQDV